MNRKLRTERVYPEGERSGDKLYPCKMRDRDTGVEAFRLSPGGTGGNEKTKTIQITDTTVLEDMVVRQGLAIRASTLNGQRKGLYKLKEQSVTGIVKA